MSAPKASEERCGYPDCKQGDVHRPHTGAHWEKIGRANEWCGEPTCHPFTPVQPKAGEQGTEITLWACPGCGKHTLTWEAGLKHRCEHGYSGGHVQVWYVEKGQHLSALSACEEKLRGVEKRVEELQTLCMAGECAGFPARFELTEKLRKAEEGRKRDVEALEALNETLRSALAASEAKLAQAVSLNGTYENLIEAFQGAIEISNGHRDDAEARLAAAELRHTQEKIFAYNDGLRAAVSRLASPATTGKK